MKVKVPQAFREIIPIIHNGKPGVVAGYDSIFGFCLFTNGGEYHYINSNLELEVDEHELAKRYFTQDFNAALED